MGASSCCPITYAHIFPAPRRDMGLPEKIEWEERRGGCRRAVEQSPDVTVISGVGIILPICSLFACNEE